MLGKLNFILILVFVGMFCNNLAADTIYLKNGRKLDGIIKSEDGDYVELEVCAGSVKFKKSEIDRIEKSDVYKQDQLRADWETQKLKSLERISREQKQEESRPKEVEFSRDSLGITLSARLNKKIDASLVLDTGATLVVLTRDIAEQLGINLDNVTPDIKLIVADGRTVFAKLVVLESVETQGVEAKNVQAAIMLDKGSNFGFGDGLLGMSFLKRFNFKVDYKEKKLVLEKL